MAVRHIKQKLHTHQVEVRPLKIHHGLRGFTRLSLCARGLRSLKCPLRCCCEGCSVWVWCMWQCNYVGFFVCLMFPVLCIGVSVRCRMPVQGRISYVRERGRIIVNCSPRGGDIRLFYYYKVSFVDVVGSYSQQPYAFCSRGWVVPDFIDRFIAGLRSFARPHDRPPTQSLHSRTYCF